MKVPDLPEGVLDLSRDSGLPLSQQIYRCVRDAARRQVLKPGVRLPSSRSLAERHGVSRNTVNAAYELLQSEGIISVSAGRTPTICEEVRPEAMDVEHQSQSGPANKAQALSARGQVMSANQRGEGWCKVPGQLQPGAPGLDSFPHDLWGRFLRRAARLAPSRELLYENPTGHPAFREVLARYLASERGVQVDPDQVLITTSVASALFGFAHILADPGDMSWIENPGYLGARTAFFNAGLQIAPLEVDMEGAKLTEALLSRPVPKLIYVTPSHQYPLGMRMSLSRRLALIDYARSCGATILEDDYDSEFLFEGRPIAAMQGLSRADEIVYLGTFSKSLLPGLRVAYAVVPKALIGEVRAAFRNMGNCANVHTQLALTDFIESGQYQAHLKRIRQLYQDRGMLLWRALHEELSDWVEVDPPSGNIQLAVRFREPRDDVRLAMRLQHLGFSVAPLGNCYLGDTSVSGLIVGYASAMPEQVDTFVKTLRRLLN